MHADERTGCTGLSCAMAAYLYMLISAASSRVHAIFQGGSHVLDGGQDSTGACGCAPVPGAVGLADRGLSERGRPMGATGRNIAQHCASATDCDNAGPRLRMAGDRARRAAVLRRRGAGGARGRLRPGRGGGAPVGVHPPAIPAAPRDGVPHHRVHASLAVHPGSAPDQFAAAVDAHDVHHVAGVADGVELRVAGLHQAAAAGAAGGDDLQGADHQVAAAGQGEEDFLHALGLPFGDAQLVAQVVIDLVAVHFHAGGGGVALVVALALAGTDGGAHVFGGGVLGEHAGRLAPAGGAAPGRWAGRGAVLRWGDGLLAGRGLGLGFVGGDGVVGFGHAGGVHGGGDAGGDQGFEGFGAFAGVLGAGRGNGRVGGGVGGVAQEVDLDARAAGAGAFGLRQFHLGGVQQGGHKQDVHQQAHQGGDAALIPFDVDVFPV